MKTFLIFLSEKKGGKKMKKKMLWGAERRKREENFLVLSSLVCSFFSVLWLDTALKAPSRDGKFFYPSETRSFGNRLEYIFNAFISPEGAIEASKRIYCLRISLFSDWSVT
jgi:hypothetical protein